MPVSPAPNLAVVACMDARLDPRALDLSEGAAHVIRNAGGMVTEDFIRSPSISQRLLGTEESVLLHHTDCAMLTFEDDDVKAQIEADTGIRPSFALGGVPGPGWRRAPLHRPHQVQPVHPPQGQGARLRLRRGGGLPAGGDVGALSAPAARA